MRIEFTAYPREAQGTGASRRLRNGGRVPGIIYGANQQAQPIELDHQTLFFQLKQEAFHASILEMTLDGGKQQVLLRDVQMHPFKPLVLHVDFQRIDKTRKIHMKVPLHFTHADICPGVKTGGGVINHIMNEINIQCLPDDLPEYIEVDLSKLNLGDSIHINDVALPKGVEPTPRLKKDNPGLVTVHLPKVVAVEEEAGAPTTEITGQAPAEAVAEGKEGDKKDAGDKKEAAKKEPAKKESAKKE